MLSTSDPLRTPRLVLRAFRETDLDDAHRFASDPEVVRYLPWEVRTRPEVLQWLRARMAGERLEGDGDAVAYAVQRISDGRVIGSVNAWWRSVEHHQGEIGFVLAGDAQGQGFAREASSALVDELFHRLGLHRICASLDARNEASAALLRRLGMRQEAHFRQNEMFKGEWGDVLVFAILRNEWERQEHSGRPCRDGVTFPAPPT